MLHKEIEDDCDKADEGDDHNASNLLVICCVQLRLGNLPTQHYRIYYLAEERRMLDKQNITNMCIFIKSL